MKSSKYLIITALALAGVTIGSNSAHALVTAAQGDLVLGFRVTDGSGTPNATFNLEVALPSFSIINSAAVANGGTIDLNYGEGLFLSNNGGLAVADLITSYGNSWNSRSNLVWSVAGHSGTAGDPAWSTFASSVTTANSSIGTTTAGANNSFATRINGEIGGLIGAPNTINTLTLVSPQAYGPADSIASSYRNTVGTGAPWYGVFAASAPVERQVSSTSLDSLNLWQFTGGASGTRALVGTFTLSDTGNFTYTAIPEPSSTAMLFGAGVLGMVTLVRRRAGKVKS